MRPVDMSPRCLLNALVFTLAFWALMLLVCW